MLTAELWISKCTMTTYVMFFATFTSFTHRPDRAKESRVLVYQDESTFLVPMHDIGEAILPLVESCWWFGGGSSSIGNVYQNCVIFS
jgi:hypothetical protein